MDVNLIRLLLSSFFGCLLSIALYLFAKPARPLEFAIVAAAGGLSGMVGMAIWLIIVSYDTGVLGRL